MTWTPTRHIATLTARALRLVIVGLAALGALGALGKLEAQQPVTIADVGPGPAGRILRDAVAAPHRLIEPDTAWFTLGRSEQARPSLIVLGRTAAVSGFVDGDVIVVAGDLHVRPGAHIGGRAIAIGGGVYMSTRAIVLGGTRAFQDDTYDITRTADGYRLTYRSLRVDDSPSTLLPGFYGVRVPAYDRVNGATISVGPSFRFFGGRGEADLLASYRSDLGKVDPALSAEVQLSRRNRLDLFASRGTFTNDDWIRSDYVNSLTVLVTGKDTRNYFRADRAELTLHHLLEGTRMQLEPFIGVRAEDAWSVGPVPGDSSAPWSVFNRGDAEEGMRRPNPPIVEGRINSALFGAAAQFEAGDVRIRARTRGEQSLVAPGDARFTQLTSELGVSFPTFGLHEYSLDVHSITTFGDTPPPQRFAYLGGSGTLAFLDLLEQGGDELLLIEQQYTVPLGGVNLGLLGSPAVFLRHRVGGAGVANLPDLEQMLGFGVTVTFARGELELDPASGKVRFSAGVSFSR
jgi:hypothetical protein